MTAAPAAPISITLNGQPRTVAAGSTLADLLKQIGQAPEAVATAVNARFVPRPARAECVLAAGDEVMLFQPIVGG